MAFSMLSPFSVLTVELFLVPHGGIEFVGAPIYILVRNCRKVVHAYELCILRLQSVNNNIKFTISSLYNK